jgi:hypothetical protein
MIRIAFAAFAFSTAAVPALAGPAADAVRFFYEPVGSPSDPEFRDRFVDPARTKFQENDTLSSNGDEIGCIDFALPVDAQDLDDAEVARTLKLDETVSGDDATVTASFNLFPGEPESRREIVWTLKKVGDAWKIADIAAPKSDWKVSEFDCTTPQ